MFALRHLAALGALLAACSRPPAREPAPAAGPVSPPVAESSPSAVAAPEQEAMQAVDEDVEELVLEPAAFDDVDGFATDRVDEALPALLRSCPRLTRGSPDREIGPGGIGGRAGDWRPVCDAAKRIPAGDADKTRAFFVEHFEPFLATDRGDSNGQFTGYYEALMRGSRVKRGRFKTPIYKRPPELVMVELKDFASSPNPRRISGKVVGGRLRPYFTRKEIDGGALAGRDLELFWIDDPIDAFFAQIQGSGIVVLDDGSRVRVGYAGKNGHRYTAIGREIVRVGGFPRDKMSMQSIRTWLEKNPKRAGAMMQRNAGFVFFEEKSEPGAIGAQGVVLTPERSLAVDPYFLPLGVPLFVSIEISDPDHPGVLTPWRKLVIAQDTGGAIRGPVRGDVFWGAGKRAFAIAGTLRSKGGYHLLLPKTAAARLSR